MKVAIVHELLVKLGGAERVAKLLWDMYPQADFYTLLYDKKKCGEVFPKNKIKTPKLLQKLYQLGIPRRFLIGMMPAAIEEFDFSEYDLVISSSSAFAHGIITGPQTKHICYCHSPARYLWDQTFEVLKQQSGLKRYFGKKLFYRLRQWDTLAAPRTDLILANSTTVEKRIKKYWRQPSKLLFPPVRTHLFEATAEHQGFFLIVSALSPFKNIELAIKVFSKLPKHRLVIIGDGVQRKYLEHLARNSGNIDLLGRKSDAVVREYLHHCRALLFPGVDDFGIVPVEAMAAGKPVIALNKGGATETIINKKTGIFFDRATEVELQNALLQFFDTKFNHQEIAQHAQQFSEAEFKTKWQKIIKTI